jgi:hypothetical protein
MFYFLGEMWPHHVAQAGLELLDSSNPSASASQEATTTGVPPSLASSLSIYSKQSNISMKDRVQSAYERMFGVLSHYSQGNYKMKSP